MSFWGPALFVSTIPVHLNELPLNSSHFSMAEQEQTLLEQVKKSDKVAFHQLFSNFHDTLFRFVVYRVQDSDLAEDITQETFLRVWKKRDTIQPEKSFFSLIARISTNLCYDHFRHMEVRHRHEELIPEFGKSHFDDPESVNQAQMLQEEIQKVVNGKLPDKCRNIFILSRIEGKTNPEIAELLSLSVRTVENQIYRALIVLKKNLKNYM
ncbi:MAG: RNA polymerase sigma-70 factor [Candidatus Marinimicrobia bacterium]|nr:RNA polymerase sigma-70 factor [Candidatus Neomarinimicrobiota bacterium]